MGWVGGSSIQHRASSIGRVDGQVTAADIFAFDNTGAAGSAAGATKAFPGDHDSNRHRQDEDEEECEGEDK